MSNEVIFNSNWGGARPNSGRLPKSDKKIQVPIMVQESKVKLLGGKKKVQAIMLKAVEDALQKLNP